MSIQRSVHIPNTYRLKLFPSTEYRMQIASSPILPSAKCVHTDRHWRFTQRNSIRRSRIEAGPSRRDILLGMDSYEDAVRPFKQDLLRDVRQPGSQRVLELGIGAAPNLQYLVNPSGPQSDGLEVIGIDPNPYMFDYARERARSAGLPSESLTLQLGIAEDLPVPHASIDAVICTLVLCSVQDVSAAVKEALRVLKPGGKLFFLEHVYAPEDRKLLRFGQKLLNPLQELLADGCHLTRDPLSVVQRSGFQSVEAQRFDVPGLGVLGPHVSGIATA